MICGDRPQLEAQTKALRFTALGGTMVKKDLRKHRRFIVVTGAAGFIGHHLCRYFRRKLGEGCIVVGIDKKPLKTHSYLNPEDYHRFYEIDLSSEPQVVYLLKKLLLPYLMQNRPIVDRIDIFALAADMGGAGYIFTGQHDYEIMNTNVRINLNTIQIAEALQADRYLFTSSACVYPEYAQQEGAAPLKEEDAYPADPDSEYGLEKLFSERVLQAWEQAHVNGTSIRIARFHNIYGPEGAYNDGREKLPAAACRKVAMAKITGNPEVEVWGNGQQVRSFCYIDDCLEMLDALMESPYREPLNIGTDHAVTVDTVFQTAADVADTKITLQHIPGPIGVSTRNADLTRAAHIIPVVNRTLYSGLESTYAWVEDQVRKDLA